MNNDQLKLYETIDISAEEREIRKQFNKSHEDITYRDFQELSREQLKVFFNYMIDHIDIRELDIGDDPKVYLAITIHLKLNGYAPKYSIEYLRKINTGEKQKASHSKNDLLNGGGEGLSCSFSEFFVYIDIKSDLFLMRGYTFDDLCVYNNLY